jgi:hypothetical protein
MLTPSCATSPTMTRQTKLNFNYASVFSENVCLLCNELPINKKIKEQWQIGCLI